jgi:tetratricopeptide (TPR) repeat protein
MVLYRKINVMPISKSEHVFNLVKSLSKAEKRNFRIYAKRIQNSEQLLFLKLFDLIDKQKNFDEAETCLNLGVSEGAQFSNLKRHLYSQIIASLRMLFKEKGANYKVREYVDYAYILYGKGLYIQALKILKKAKEMAKKHHLIYLQLTIIEFEKKIETRHITRSGTNYALNLLEESERIQKNANHLVGLSNLRIQMHAKYLQDGHVKSREEAEAIRAYYHAKIDPMDFNDLGLMERIFYVQSRVWYNYILLDFKSCMKYAVEWIELLDRYPNMIERDTDLYMRGYHYVLTAANHTKNYTIHKEYLERFEAFRYSNYKRFNANSQILSFLYVHTGRLNSIMLNGNFNEAEPMIQKSVGRIRKYNYKLDDHRIMVFYFKFAWIYLGANKTDKAISYLNKIINNELNKLREDIQNYARILMLICHYESGNIDILQYLINTYSAYFQRKKAVSNFLKISMDLFSELKSKGPSEHRGIIKKYYEVLKAITEDPYESRVLDYVDIISWMDSKIRNIPLQTYIENKKP